LPDYSANPARNADVLHVDRGITSLSAAIAGLDPAIHEASQVISRKDFGFAPHHGCAGQARAWRWISAVHVDRSTRVLAVIAGLDPAIHEASQVISRKNFGFAPHHGCAGQARAWRWISAVHVDRSARVLAVIAGLDPAIHEASQV